MAGHFHRVGIPHEEDGQASAAQAQENPEPPPQEEEDEEDVGDGEDAAAEPHVGSEVKEERTGGDRNDQAQQRPAQILGGTPFGLHFVGSSQVKAEGVNHEAEDPGGAVLLVQWLNKREANVGGGRQTEGEEKNVSHQEGQFDFDLQRGLHRGAGFSFSGRTILSVMIRTAPPRPGGNSERP